MAFKSAFSLFTPSKEIVLRNLTSFFVIVFLPMLLQAVGDMISGGKSSNPTVFISPTIAPWFLGGGVLSLLLLPAGFYLELQGAKGKTLNLGETFSGSMKYFWRILGLVILVGLVVMLGLLAFIIPGIIAIQRFFLAPYFLIDKDLGIIEALRQSSAAAKGKARAIWGIIGVILLLSLFGIIPMIGGLVSAVLTLLYTCAPALRYRELKQAAKV